MKRDQAKRDAIKESIVHWNANREELPKLTLITGDKCALCKLYYTGNAYCKGCPLSQLGDNCNDEDSIWRKLRDVCLTDKNPIRWKAACTEMLTALKECLDAT